MTLGRALCRPPRSLYALLVSAAAIAGLCRHAPAEPIIQFQDVTAATGVSFMHTDGNSDNYYIMETVSAGLALFDYNNNGYDDIYFLNGAPLKGARYDTPPRNALYRNNGDLTFTDVTEASGLGDMGYGLGVTVGDYNGDGFLDVYLNNYGPNKLYRNNGDGTFTDVTAEAGVGNGDQVGAGALFLDINGNGLQDLYVANYLEFSYDDAVRLTQMGVPVYANPRHYKPVPDTLFRNNGDGTFTDISMESGIGQHAGWGMGIVAADFDNDGDIDIFIGNDVAENFLFLNDGTGKFEQVGLMAGVAYDLHGDEQGSMGADCGDFNNDGLLDLYVTSYQTQFATLYQNLGDGFFEDVTVVTGAGASTLPQVTWGNTIQDFNNNGHRDIFVACGHLQVHIDQFNDVSQYKTRNLIQMNTGDGKFVNITDRAGDGMQVRKSSRGAAFGDLDHDGRLDAVILNSRDIPTILRNVTPTGDNRWLQVALRGTNGNTFGVGARVYVQSGDQRWLDTVHSGRGYQGHHGLDLHFGLGKREKVDRIEVHWVGGGVEVVENVDVGQRVTIRQGEGIIAGLGLPALKTAKGE